MSETSSENRFTAQEWKSLGALCAVFFLRMLGLFMILPVLSPYAKSMPGSSPMLIGLAMGAFPLTQTILQIPFGWVSDRMGRKPVLIVGLSLFVLGSIGAGWARTITELIFALAVQGSGAVASVILAYVADCSREIVRARAMAVVGGAVGLAFGLGFVLGPLIAGWGGTAVIFYCIAALSFAAILVVAFIVPRVGVTKHRDDVQLSASRLTHVLTDSNLWKIHTGIFVMNGALRGLFVVLPFVLHGFIDASNTWLVYLSVLVACGIIMFPAIFLSEKYGWLGPLTFGSIVIMGLGLVGFVPGDQYFFGFILALFGFLLGFSLLEAILPSLITNLAPERDRGTAVGVFNMSQYFGAFLGSLVGGYFLQGNLDVLYLILAMFIGIWGLWFLKLDYDFSGSLHRTTKPGAR